MTDYRWSDLRDHAIRRYRDVPSANQEQRIIDVFKQRPELVAAAIDHVAERFDVGTVSNPWPFLATHVKKAVLVEVDARATDASAKDRAVRVVEQWIRAAGAHCPSEAELIAELYGETERTPPLGLLLELEEQTRDAPGRSNYDGLLNAAIARTIDEGPQEVPGGEGRLRAWAGDEALRERLVGLWREVRPRGEQVDREALERGGHVGGEVVTGGAT